MKINLLSKETIKCSFVVQCLYCTALSTYLFATCMHTCHRMPACLHIELQLTARVLVYVIFCAYIGVQVSLSHCFNVRVCIYILVCFNVHAKICISMYI
jgi:hypothetical protein